jgi:orotidine-5'-phosphate decarboxylase
LISFTERLAKASRKNQSLLCVGLDPDPARMPLSSVFKFNKAIVDATKDLVCAYKPNIAFYEALGLDGLNGLQKTVAYIRQEAPNVVILCDAKRGDGIDSSNAAYAKALFEVWNFDAATVNGFAGGQAMEPFFKYEDKGVFVLCHLSNPGAGEFQDLTLDGSKMPLYEFIAERASHWNTRGNVGLVVGATYPGELRAVRSHCHGMPILIPGVGAQGGNLENSVKAGLDSDAANILINSSRGIIYASSDRSGFAEAARQAAENLRSSINRILITEDRGWS